MKCYDCWTKDITTLSSDILSNDTIDKWTMWNGKPIKQAVKSECFDGAYGEMTRDCGKGVCVVSGIFTISGCTLS